MERPASHPPPDIFECSSASGKDLSAGHAQDELGESSEALGKFPESLRSAAVACGIPSYPDCFRSPPNVEPGSVSTHANARHRLQESLLWQGYFRSRYAILFYALLLMLIALPAATLIGLPQMLLKVLLGATLLAAVMPNATKRSRYLVLACVVVLFVARLFADRDEVPIDTGLAQLVVALIGLLTAAGALRFVIKSEEVDSETLYAALSTYLIAGVFFGELFWSIEQLAPGSYGAPDALSETSMVYFSFVTLASLGYGDILPKTDFTRGLAMSEVIGGQLFLAVMVARLISVFVDTKPAR